MGAQGAKAADGQDGDSGIPDDSPKPATVVADPSASGAMAESSPKPTLRTKAEAVPVPASATPAPAPAPAPASARPTGGHPSAASEPASGDTATADAFIIPIKKMVQLTQWLWSNRIRETHPLPSWMPPINDYHIRPANLAAECELTPYHIEGMQWLNRHYEVRNRSFIARS